MSDSPLLTAAQERDLFRRMNYLKYQANALRMTLDPDAPDIVAMESAERLLVEARSLRDQIVRANIRLVMSVVKKFVTPRNTFDEMFSDGLLTLMKTVEKFDFSRGFRFSTYAYRALTSNTYRSLAERRSREARFVPWSDTLRDPRDERSFPSNEPDLESLADRIDRMLVELDERERFVVCGRFALGSQNKARTFQSLAEDLGLSKERVRQIERHALSKLHSFALEMGWDASLESVLNDAESTPSATSPLRSSSSAPLRHAKPLAKEKR